MASGPPKSLVQHGCSDDSHPTIKFSGPNLMCLYIRAPPYVLRTSLYNASLSSCFIQLVQDIPEEHCTLVPVRECTDSVKIVPNLVPTSECVPVSQEVCTTEKVNPRKVKRPVVKKWCGKQESKEEEVRKLQVYVHVG